MGIFMSIPHLDSVGKVQKILLFETVFHDSASDCTTLTLAYRILRKTSHLAETVVHNSHKTMLLTCVSLTFCFQSYLIISTGCMFSARKSASATSSFRRVSTLFRA